jgi:hypothetical protein
VSYKESPEAAHRICTHTFEIAQGRRCEALATAFPAVFEALFDGDLATSGKARKVGTTAANLQGMYRCYSVYIWGLGPRARNDIWPHLVVKPS